MNQVETDFLSAQEKVPLVWFRYIDNIFLYGLMDRMS